MQSASTDRIHQSMILSSGHRIGFAEFGDPEGIVVFYCHGFPSSRLEGRLYDAAAVSSSVRLIVVDRPGYGFSTKSISPQRYSDSIDLVEKADECLYRAKNQGRNRVVLDNKRTIEGVLPITNNRSQ